MKEKRQKAILKLIQEEDLEVQEELLERLHAMGFSCTQATISRDIKELHLVKERTKSGTYKYVVSVHRGRNELAQRLQTIFRESVISFDLAQNLIVLKTMPGLANAAAAALDSMEIPNMVGSIAGDDTAVLIMRTNANAEEFCNEIHLMLK
ncbi:MAG: arginine repressor [Oscillospiraceae bacterium]|nr:arginine repressor [Oscillospiraceae bacterium]